MLDDKTKKQVIKLAKKAGVEVNGEKPWDIKVYNDKFYKRILAQGSLGLGESYMDSWWDAQKLDEFFNKVLSARLSSKLLTPGLVLTTAASHVLNRQSKERSKKVAETHYDLGNDFYEDMLDKRMQYTCAYWKNASSLDEAQEHKLDLVCKKLELKSGERLLELGCGWGGFAKFAAQKYGVSVVAYNISKEQVAYARKSCEGLPVEIVQDDYRNAKGEFDKITSIGMAEHVGYKNYHTFMEVAHKNLKDRGLFLVHTIGSNISHTSTDPWIEKYIFPNSMLPSIKQLSKAFEKLFVMEDWHNFGADYDKTLMAWFENFEKNWPKHKDKYGERFYKMWKYYLLSCAGLFRAREAQLWQIVLSKNGKPGGYTSIR